MANLKTKYPEALTLRLPTYLLRELELTAERTGKPVAEVIRQRCLAGMDLSKVSPEDLGLDPDNYSDPLVRKILAAEVVA